MVLVRRAGRCVGVDSQGNAYAVYNTLGMFTGIADHTGRWVRQPRMHTRRTVHSPRRPDAVKGLCG
jgi:hypothetical protein